MSIVLYVGERNYSSWSLRPWLVLKWSGLAFEDRLVSLDQPGYGEGRIGDILAVSPSGRVPALQADGLAIWDSLAISEWTAEAAPQAQLWPADPHRRALARAVAAEMHAGFAALRRDLPMNIRRRTDPQEWAAETRRDLERVEEIWTRFRNENRTGGSHLFGARSIADAFFTPIATRLRTYGLTFGPIAQTYCQTLLEDGAFKEWERRALDEWKAPFSRVKIDALYA